MTTASRITKQHKRKSSSPLSSRAPRRLNTSASPPHHPHQTSPPTIHLRQPSPSLTNTSNTIGTSTGTAHTPGGPPSSLIPLWPPTPLDLPFPYPSTFPSPSLPSPSPAPSLPILPIRAIHTAPLTVELNPNIKQSLLSPDAALLLNAVPAPFAPTTLHGPTVKVWLYEIPLAVTVLPEMGGIVRQRYLVLGRPAIEQVKCLLYLIKDEAERRALSNLVEGALARKGWGKGQAMAVRGLGR